MVGLGIFSILVLILGSVILGVLKSLFAYDNSIKVISLLVCCLMAYLAIVMTGPLAPFFIVVIIGVYLAATK